jgi:ketosteroid isomerase-like protein
MVPRATFSALSVSVSGDVALVSAYADDDRGNNSGSAYVFTRQQDGTWTQTQKLTASDGAAATSSALSVGQR